MLAVPIHTTLKLTTEIVQFLQMSQGHLRVLLQQPVQISGPTLLSTNPKKIRQPHARPNAPIKLPISSASKP